MCLFVEWIVLLVKKFSILLQIALSILKFMIFHYVYYLFIQVVLPVLYFGIRLMQILKSAQILKSPLCSGFT